VVQVGQRCREAKRDGTARLDRSIGAASGGNLTPALVPPTVIWHEHQLASIEVKGGLQSKRART
jgi:hypothetical protein